MTPPPLLAGLFDMPEAAYRRRSCPVCGGAWNLPERDGTVTYAVQRQGWVKIGKTSDLRERLRCLRLVIPPESRRGHHSYVRLPDGMDPAAPLLLVRVWPGDVEHELHVRFALDHAAGEWFRPGPALRDELARAHSCPTARILADPWRLCTRNPRYEVSWDGRIRNRRTGKLIRAVPCGRNGNYLKVNLGRALQVMVHQLVAEAWHGPRPAGIPHQVDHLDFETLRNVATNLRWLPSRENNLRRRLTGADWALTRQEEPDGYKMMTPDEEAVTLEAMAAAGW